MRPEKVLVIGAGGVGCEILLPLTKLNFTKIAIIDYDRIEITNLHRQFLFRPEDIGSSKAKVAARRLREYSSVNVEGIDGRVEEIDDLEFFGQFQIVILAVDNLESRRWINSVVMGLEGKRIIVDVGTEGFKASIRIWRFGLDDACLECTTSLFSGPIGEEENWRLPVCSLTGRPSSFRQCILWAAWMHEEKANELELGLIIDSAVRRAQEFDIHIPTNNARELEELVKSTLKRTIPAVAAVNSLIASIAITKAVSLLHNDNPRDSNNFCMINAEVGFYQLWTRLERDPACIICKSSQ